jgi:digeranylgeranylglycerophospholipid reductase
MKGAYDVVVIGAGPAGSIAARTTAQAGLTTLLLEKRQEIGSPVRCAEAVGRDTVERFIPLDARWIAAEIETFSVTNSIGECAVLPTMEKTLVLERKIFDRELAHSAAKAGADVVVKTRATGLVRNVDGTWRVKMVVQGEPREVSARIVIGADGTESQSARWAGLKTVPALKNFYSAAQYLLTGVDVDPHICQYHIGWSMAPEGYCWVFPKGDQTANVGLVIGVSPDATRTAMDYLNAFVAAHFPGRPILAQVVGGIPISNVLRHMVADGFMVVGDAAHQSDPLTGGGITNGMHGGMFAGQTAIAAIRKDDTTAGFLSQYDRAWDAEFGAMYRQLYRIRQAILKLPQAKFDDIIAQTAKFDIRHLSLVDVLKIAIKAHPQLLVEALPYFLHH